MRVVSLGDLVVDVVVRTDPRSRRPPTRHPSIALTVGGQGANVAAWCAALGADARWLGKRGEDAAGRLVKRSSRPTLGVRLTGPVEPTGRASSSRSSISPASGRCSPIAVSR